MNSLTSTFYVAHRTANAVSRVMTGSLGARQVVRAAANEARASLASGIQTVRSLASRIAQPLIAARAQLAARTVSNQVGGLLLALESGDHRAVHAALTRLESAVRPLLTDGRTLADVIGKDINTIAGGMDAVRCQALSSGTRKLGAMLRGPFTPDNATARTAVATVENALNDRQKSLVNSSDPETRKKCYQWMRQDAGSDKNFLGVILNSPKGGALRTDFVKHLENEHSIENLHFLDACEQLKQTTDVEAAEALAKQILEDCVTVGGSQQVNVSGKQRQEVLKRLEPEAMTGKAGAQLAEHFSEAITEVQALIQSDSLVRFAKPS